MQGLLESAMANPWTTLRTVLDGPLHPGGTNATDALLDRAGVTAETRLLDVGCGAGEAVSMARARDAEAVGVDRDPAGDGAGRATSVRGDLTALPVRDGSVDVVLAECVLCLVPNRQRALAEARRVLAPDGRLALSDVVVHGDLPSLPAPVVRALCLEDSQSRSEMVQAVEDAGFVVDDVRDHQDALLAMRDQVAGRVEYERILPLLGDRGAKLLEGIQELEAATEDGRVSYVSLVARRSE
jgi:ubiquinone/menaquinone biosynthesis C-methylase UbiE